MQILVYVDVAIEPWVYSLLGLSGLLTVRNWFGKFILTVFVSFCCIIGALGAKYLLSVLLLLVAKGCWVLFVVAFFLEQG